MGSHRVVVNGNGALNGVPGPCPEGHHLSPLTSPLLTDAGCVRNDDEDEARRKVVVKTGRIEAESLSVSVSQRVFLFVSRSFPQTRLTS